ncbi:hypothetical protein CRM22_002205 [Opisthorchis felineus]|uniref:FERM domain-containing protein n=1 Tax=Opisthorchis felineus TaxID=147828 RepID=A0A4S2MD49_OPIFE|nr:hypothetical protein CRM22_002205 [Opisthorchis felineus]
MDVQCAGRGLRKMQLKVLHLDDTVHTFQLSVHATGQELHASMVDRLHLLESDYFDLEYVNDEGMRCWLDHDKPILRQISPGRDLLFRFGVKFYTPYPNLLDEECTRYLFALQVKRDLVTGTLLCSENTAALLASYVVQAEIGDFMEEEYHSIDYLRPLKLLHDPTDDRLQRVMEFHKAHLGLSPSEADLALLDTARKVEFYGLRLHFVRNHEGLGLNLAVSHLGILVFQNLIRINTFSWAKIRKLSFKRKRFLVKLQPERFDNIEFIFDSREECKHFWKHCIEHHTFFRCPKAEQALSKQGQPGQRFSRSGSTFRYTGRTEQELHEYVQEHGENRINFERPSSARRAYSTLLSGSSYTSKRLQTASLQLRSSSADRRAVTMFSNNLGVSLTNTLGHSSGLKRTQSEGTRPAARDSQEESAVMVSGQSNADELPEAPTSGYVTTTESAGSRQSTDANIVPETEEDMATNMERLEGEQVSEMDPLRWITETYRRMTGDWTSEGVLAEEKQDTSTVMRRAKSAAGSPRTSGTASLGRLDTELDSLLLHQQQGAPTVQIAAAEDDGALTHFLLLSEISRTIVPGATIQTGPDTSQSDRQGETSLQVSSPTEQQQQTSDILSDLTGAVLFSGTDISDLVSRVVSPYPEMSSEREEVRVSSSLSTTQPDLLSQADAGLSQRGCVHPATDLFGDAHRVAASLADTCTQQPSGSEAASVVSSFLTQPTGAQIQQTPTEFLDDLNLRAGQSAVFILPTVTQYGLDINIDRSQQQIRSFDPTPAEAVSSTHPPHHSEAEPTAQSNLGSESVTFQNYSLQSGFPYSQTSWSTVTPAYSVPSVPEPDGRKFVLASVHPEPLTYGAGQTAGALKNKFQSRQPKSSLGTSLLSSRSTGQIPASGVSTAAYPFFPRETVEVRRSRPPTEPLQAAPFDRWSSSGSDSTTGVILRPELSKTELGNGNIRTNSSGSLLRQHKTGCPHASASTRQSQPSTQITSAMSVTSSNQLPILPVDTLPARPSHHRNMLAHTCGQSSILSHSIPCDVHLSGLHAEMRRIEAYRHIGVKDSDVNKNTKKTSNERQLRRPYPRGYPVGGGGGGGEHTHTDMLPMELTDSAAAEMLEEVPYVVIRRPRSVDVKQYQLHLQRQQQQAAAMAAAAAGYPFHPGAPPFFGESHHHHAAAAAAAAAAYHYSGRMPVAPQFTYGPMPTAYHHHHHQAPVAPSRSELPPDVKCGRSAKHHSVGPGDHRSDARQERARQARPSQQALHHHERFPEGLDPYAPVAPMHREKCKAKRKHSKTPESSMVKEYDANRSKRHTKPATGATPALDDVLHHHAQCVHRRRLMDPNMPEESTEKRAVMQAKRQVRPKPTSTTADSGSKQPATRAGSSGRSPSRTKDVPVLEAGDSRQKRRTAEPLDDSRETEVPYPVSEIFFSPARGSESADTRQSKLPSAARHHHHHHPACASLMGRTRASQLQKQPLKPAKITTSDAALASASVPQLQRGQMRDEPALKMSARSWASDDRYPLDRGSIVPQARADRMSRKQEDPAVRPVMSDTRETIEKLRQELRSAGFQVKDTLPSRTVTDWGRPSSMGSGHQPIGTKSTTKPSHKPVPKTSPSEQKPTEIAHGSIESRKPAGTPSDVTEPDKPVAQAAISLATAGGVDLPFGGPPRNPIYLDSDTDSEEVSRQRKEPDVVSRPQDSQEILREPLSTTASTMETIEAPAGDQEGELSVDVTETGHVQPVISPRSPSPSLPLSFVPCDGGDDETDVSLGSQASLLNSPDSASYCSTCDRIDSYDSPSPSSSHSCCHSHHRRRYHSSCHGHRRHHHGHRHHGHYRSHRYYHRNYTCRCHSCVSHHHRRHLSDQRNAYRESRHHSVKPYRASHRVDSSPHKPQRSSSDRRHGYGTSSSEPSELSWTNSLSESSAQDEIPGDHWIEDALTLERRSMIVEELLAKEQKLRAQIAKHRALAYELKQTREQTQKLLGPEPRRQAGRLGRKGDVSDHSKDKGMDDSVRSTSKKGSEASSHKGSTVVSRQKEGGPTKEDKHVDEGHPNRKHGVTKDECVQSCEVLRAGPVRDCNCSRCCATRQ